jgi:hypothetical protein
MDLQYNDSDTKNTSSGLITAPECREGRSSDLFNDGECVEDNHAHFCGQVSLHVCLQLRVPAYKERYQKVNKKQSCQLSGRFLSQLTHTKSFIVEDTFRNRTPKK